ncbi:MAG: carbonic anhydrase family protein [Bacteroidales bacterium]|nr:carbonic anhydrase family protein [Bacteroidales bacterium]MDT8430419.1 carbonic anhydrase family protein [Bacteroidales bacterium]
MDTITREMQQQMTPGEALERLMAGNQRVLEGKPVERNHALQVQQTSTAQYPFAAVLGCIDSRAAAEHIFDLGIGDIFNARVAGNIVNDDILGSLEFACKVIGSKLILVMGHTNCGAVISACDHVELGNITSLLCRIQPAVSAFGNAAANTDQVAAYNVQLSVAQIRQQSPVLAEMEEKRELMIRGAMYDVATGKVALLPDYCAGCS